MQLSLSGEVSSGLQAGKYLGSTTGRAPERAAAEVYVPACLLLVCLNTLALIQVVQGGSSGVKRGQGVCDVVNYSP
jgi:hypothetical protein